MLGDFIKCPFCAGHESVSPEAAAHIADAIADWIYMEESPLKTELANIRNAILNTQERETEVDPLLT